MNSTTIPLSNQSKTATDKLPKGWREARLGDICEIKSGKRLPKGQGFAEDRTPFPYIRVVDFKQGSVDSSNLKYLDEATRHRISRYIIRTHDVYISIAGSIGIVGTIPDELDGANLTENAARLVINDHNCLARDYLTLFLSSPVGQKLIADRTNTVGQPKLALTRIATIPIPLPPLAEQKRIAGILKDKLAQVAIAQAAAEAQLEAAEDLSAAYLRKRFEGGLSSQWPRMKLAEICRDISDGTHFTPAYVSKGVPFLSVKDVRETGISFDDCRFISVEQHEDLCRRCKPEQGDVLYTKVGTTGIAKAIDVETPFSIFVSVALLKLMPLVSPEFLELVLNAPICRRQAEALTQGAANRNLVLRDLKTIEIPVPPVETQRAIARELKAAIKKATELQRIVSERNCEIEVFPATLLRHAFQRGL